MNAAVAKRDEATTRAAARRFVGHTDVSFKDDRIPEVVSAYERSLLREMVIAADSKDERGAKRLVDEANDLNAWSEPAKAAAGGEAK
jgi:hypothetical protein